ncbi:MAG TPA: hypothetical protein ENJ29_12530 [Bacteroidetes bacterium]|nr:hypothetical protein [Bacteroidota bacterium]
MVEWIVPSSQLWAEAGFFTAKNAKSAKEAEVSKKSGPAVPGLSSCFSSWFEKSTDDETQ